MWGPGRMVRGGAVNQSSNAFAWEDDIATGVLSVVENIVTGSRHVVILVEDLFRFGILAHQFVHRIGRNDGGIQVRSVKGQHWDTAAQVACGDVDIANACRNKRLPLVDTHESCVAGALSSERTIAMQEVLVVGGA